MKTGQIFRVDAQTQTDTAAFYKVTVDSFSDKMPVGSEWAIAKSKVTDSVTKLEVRASRVLSGSVQKGRPRRFPRHVVARLLGELTDESLVNPPTTFVPAPTPVVTDEETSTVDEDEAASVLAASDTSEANSEVEEEEEELVQSSTDSSW